MCIIVKRSHYHINFILILTLYFCIEGFISVDGDNCTHLQWQCDNGDCIEGDTLCDGKINCPDSSDENANNCIGQQCSSFAYQCAYGACVRGSALCNELKDCADGSDELDIVCKKITTMSKLKGPCEDNKLQCKSSECIANRKFCDGIKHCSDGSDEKLDVCAEHNCKKNQFRCAYGGCIPIEAVCNGTAECHDRSDEALRLCKIPPQTNCTLGTTTPLPTSRITTATTPRTITIPTTPTIQQTYYTLRTTTPLPTSRITTATSPRTITIPTTPTIQQTYYTLRTTTPLPTSRITTSTTPTLTIPTTPNIPITTVSTTTTTTPKTTTIASSNIPRSSYKSCQIPTDETNMFGKILECEKCPLKGAGSIALNNDIVEFYCYDDYGLMGNKQVRCLNSEWEHDLPKCILKTPITTMTTPRTTTFSTTDIRTSDVQGCRIPTGETKMFGKYKHCRRCKILNPGNPVSKDYTIEFYCDRGYSLDGMKRVKCLSAGWEHNPPKCIQQCRLSWLKDEGYLWSTYGVPDFVNAGTCIEIDDGIAGCQDGDWFQFSRDMCISGIYKR